MDKDNFEALAMDYLAGVMTEEEKRGFQTLLDSDEHLANQFGELLVTYQKMEHLQESEPSSNMDDTFYTMLYTAMEKEHAKKQKRFNLGSLTTFFSPKLALGALLVVFGVALGYWLNWDRNQQAVEIVGDSNETEMIRQKLVLTLLEQPSANQRLQGVSEANKIESADEIVIQALLQTLNNDSNVNVRLAAIESLSHYVDKPAVRQGLVQSIPNQESPILQITLANLMVALQEKSSIEPFKQLLKEKQLDTTVQKKIRNSIESII
nr:HEAT repeat domain-containing protein [Allomuricauda sp.]